MLWLLLTLLLSSIAQSADTDFAIDALRELFPGEFGPTNTSSNKDRRDTQNWHYPSSTDSTWSLGGDPSTLDGAFFYKNGFSTSVWNATYATGPKSIKFNVTMDLGYCNTSIRRTTNMGVYTFANGTVRENVTFIDLAEDIKTLIDPKDPGNTTRVNDHLVNLGLDLLDDIDRALAHIPKICDLRNQTYLGDLVNESDQYGATSGLTTETEPVEILHDELRRKLLMLPTHTRDTSQGGGSGGPGTPPANTEPTPTGVIVPVASNLATAALLTGPTAQAYTLYLILGGIGAPVVGGLGGLLGQLVFSRIPTDNDLAENALKGAIALFLAFMYTAWFLGRPLAAGTLNAPGERTGRLAARTRDSIITPLNNAIGTNRDDRDRRPNGAGEGSMMASVLAILRSQARENERRLSEMEMTSRQSGFTGEFRFSSGFNPSTNTFTRDPSQQGSSMSFNFGTNQADPNQASSSRPQRQQCDLSDMGMREALGLMALRSDRFAYDDATLDELSPDQRDDLLRQLEEQARERDRWGHCSEDWKEFDEEDPKQGD